MRVAAGIGVDLARTAFLTAENGNIDALRIANGTFPVQALEHLEPCSRATSPRSSPRCKRPGRSTRRGS